MKIYCNTIFNKSEIKKLINWMQFNYGSIRTYKLLDKIKILGFKHATEAGISIGLEDLKIPKEKKNLFLNTTKTIEKTKRELNNGNITLLNSTEKIIKSWSTTNEILKNEVVNNFRQTNLLNPLYIMTFSGARGNLSQIKQLIGMRGLISDSKGDIADLPIKKNLKEGLGIIEYFISCYGARKGLVDTALKTANSGYLTRKLIYAAQNEIIKKPKCQSKKGIILTTNKKNKKFYNLTKEKTIGRIVSKNIKDTKNEKIIVNEGQDICNYIYKKIINFKKIYVKSPITCNLIKGTCQLCYGWNLGNGRMIELGESIGILASQSIGEPGTQLTMRTFHTGGVFSGETNETIKSPSNGIIYYNSKKGGRKIKTNYGEKAFLTTQEKNIRIKENKNIILIINLPKYSIIFTRKNKKIFKEQIIAEIPKFIKIKNQEKEFKKIKTNLSGETLIKESTKKLWIISGNILSYYILIKGLKKDKFYKRIYFLYKNKNKKKLHKKKKKKIKLKLNTQKTIKIKFLKRNITLKECYIVNKNIIKEKQIFIKKKQTEKKIKLKKYKIKLGKFNYKNTKIRKRKNKMCSQILQKEKEMYIIRKANPFLISKDTQEISKNYKLIKKGNEIFSLLYKKQKTEDIVQGLPKINEIIEARKKTTSLTKNLHEKLKSNFINLNKSYNNKIATRKSIEKIQKYIIKNIQNVYSNQRVKICDKHIEIIAKQMTGKVIIIKQGRSQLMIGEILEINKVERINEKIKNKAKYTPIIIGISRIALSKQSFISEASFQETTAIISKAAIEGKTDWLYGLKENIILGNIMPTGTGYGETTI
jgi:DNA-directed RNA polymerase subunit beta'